MPDSQNVSAVPPSRLWRAGRILLILAGVLVTIVVIVCLFENWRGRRNWNAFRTEWQAKGETFDFASMVPPPPPREQNFAMTPLLAPLLDYRKRPNQPVWWNNPQGNDKVRALGDAFKGSGRKKAPGFGQWQSCQFIDLREWQEYLDGNTNFPFATSPTEPARDVLTALRKFDAELEELAAASSLPFSIFPIHYQENVQALLPHLATLKGILQIVRLRALARLGADQRSEALADIHLGLRLAESLKGEPFLISQLVRIAMLQIAMQPIWEGCAQHDWSEAQLSELQTTLVKVRILEDYGRTIRGERALGNAAIDDLRIGRLPLSSLGDATGSVGSETANYVGWLVPSGWYFQNQVTLNRLCQERCLPLVDVEKHRVNVEQTENADDIPELKTSGLYNVFARLLLPAVSKSAMKFAHGQTVIDLAAVACALERHRLAAGSYPERLAALVPRYVERIPTDVITGESLRYQRTSADQFVLYSVGWNETDDGGEIHVRKSGDAPDPKKSDWVWRYELP